MPAGVGLHGSDQPEFEDESVIVSRQLAIQPIVERIRGKLPLQKCSGMSPWSQAFR